MTNTELFCILIIVIEGMFLVLAMMSISKLLSILKNCPTKEDITKLKNKIKELK